MNTLLQDFNPRKISENHYTTGCRVSADCTTVIIRIEPERLLESEDGYMLLLNTNMCEILEDNAISINPATGVIEVILRKAKADIRILAKAFDVNITHNLNDWQNILQYAKEQEEKELQVDWLEFEGD